LFAGGESATAPKVSAEPAIPFEHLTAGNIEKAIEGYRQIKKEKPDNASVSEGRINGLGYGFLRAKKLPEAIAYFKLNVEFYPKSSNVYDSLGEAYMAQGEKELAIANYKKSLELDPKNNNAVEMLKKLTTP
jgi:tetratricopeptide (TPR) repeat protein